jgi:hypothetical protein
LGDPDEARLKIEAVHRIAVLGLQVAGVFARAARYVEDPLCGRRPGANDVGDAPGLSGRSL